MLTMKTQIKAFKVHWCFLDLGLTIIRPNLLKLTELSFWTICSDYFGLGTKSKISTAQYCNKLITTKHLLPGRLSLCHVREKYSI